MKRQIMACFYLCMAGILLADDAIINEATTYSQNQTTSVVISYSGVEKLKFFALDSTDDVLSLDMPGTYSRFDFASLTFPQVREVKQMPLDPDVSSGISIRFFLNEGVTYSIFEANQSLTILFENHSAENGVANVHVPGSAPTEAGSSSVQTLSGKPGKGRLSDLTVSTETHGGKIEVLLDSSTKSKHFFLKEPERFVVDFHETVLSLSENRLALDHPLVSRIRLNQFQTVPTPISRMVLDLNSETQIQVVTTEKGLVIAFAGNQADLGMVLNGDPNTPESLSADAVVESAPETKLLAPITETIPEDEEQIVATAPVAPITETIPKDEEQVVATTPVAPIAETMPEDEEQVVATAPVAPIAETIPEDEEQVVATAPVAPIAAVTPEAEAQVVATAPAASMEASSHVEPVLNAADVAPEASSAAHVTAMDESQNAPSQAMLPVEDVVVPSVEPSPSLKVANQIAMVNNQHRDDSPSAESVKDTELPSKVPVQANADLPNLESRVSEIEESPVVMVEDLTAQEPSLSDAPVSDQAKAQSPIVMASDIDLEMENFLKEESKEKTIYQQMKGVQSTRRNRGEVHVTNDRIFARKAVLGAPPQDATQEDRAGEFEELFEEKDDAIKAVGEDSPKYRGFDIMIDIRDQPVIDLLRFLAEEVGFNLYVDSSVGDIRATYKFRNIPWDQALEIILSNANLDKEFRNGVLRVATTEKFRSEEQSRLALIVQRELSVPMETVTVDLNYSKAKELVPIVQEYLSPRGSIIKDDRTNILIIRDIPKYMVDIRTLINRLDKRIPQVSIEARIVETTTSFLKELGIQWGLTGNYSPETGTNTGLDFPHRVNLGGPQIGRARSINGPAGGYAVNLPTINESSGFGLTLGNFLDNFKLDISMQLLESEGNGQIISSPKVTTQNNKTALLVNGQQIPIQTIQRGVITTTYVNAALELEVTPQITADETIILDLVVDKSEADFSRTVNGNPVIKISRAETQVLVKNGGTAVIGGIFALTEQSQVRGLPTLRKIPVLKRLFSNELTQYSNQELLIFVTPKIVKY